MECGLHDTGMGAASMNSYRCNHCGKVVARDSEKRWIKSYCEATGKMTRLWLVRDKQP
ncbi:MAG TPA: hypothetical protein VFH56_14220 [Acidimicrobiales bacterium]|nr:hypothetical protein [Acidimicrobiales bacterium]